MEEISHPITKEVLKSEGFEENRVDSNTIFRKGGIYVTHSGLRWQICDCDGHVGNEYVDTIEQLYLSVNH